MMDFASPSDRLNHFWFVFEQLVDREIASDNKSLMLERESSSFDFSCAAVMVHPDLEIVT